MARWLLFAVFATATALVIYPPTGPRELLAGCVFFSAIALGWAFEPIVRRKDYDDVV